MPESSRLLIVLRLAAIIAAASWLLPYNWLVGPPRDLFWRFWLPAVLSPLFVLYWPNWRKRATVLSCCVVYWLVFALLINLHFYSKSSTQFCLAYRTEKLGSSAAGITYGLFLLGPAVSGCEDVSPVNVLFEPLVSAYVASGWASMNDFDVVVRPGWNSTLMTVVCRGRRFSACDQVPGETQNVTDWRTKVPVVPTRSLPAVCFILVMHVLVFVGVQLSHRHHQHHHHRQYISSQAESEREPLDSPP